MKAHLAVLLAALCALALVMQPSPSASAEKKWSRIGLSRDAHHWSAKLQDPLFDRHLVLLPGSGRTERFYVRNQSGETARLKVLVRVRDKSGWLRDPHFRIRTRTAGHRWIRVRGNRKQHATQMILRPGQVVPVSVNARLGWRSGNRTLGRNLRFGVVVRLTQKTGKGGR